jgi:hypothetical protein
MQHVVVQHLRRFVREWLSFGVSVTGPATAGAGVGVPVATNPTLSTTGAGTLTAQYTVTQAAAAPYSNGVLVPIGITNTLTVHCTGGGVPAHTVAVVLRYATAGNGKMVLVACSGVDGAEPTVTPVEAAYDVIPSANVVRVAGRVTFTGARFGGVIAVARSQLALTAEGAPGADCGAFGFSTAAVGEPTWRCEGYLGNGVRVYAVPTGVAGGALPGGSGAYVVRCSAAGGDGAGATIGASYTLT